MNCSKHAISRNTGYNFKLTLFYMLFSFLGWGPKFMCALVPVLLLKAYDQTVLHLTLWQNMAFKTSVIRENYLLSMLSNVSVTLPSSGCCDRGLTRLKKMLWNKKICAWNKNASSILGERGPHNAGYCVFQARGGNKPGAVSKFHRENVQRACITQKV